MTTRNMVMFGPVGRTYIYFTYGNHYCFNVTAKSKNQIAGAVLIRGLEPKEGIEYMKDHRNVDDIRLLTNGPGKITKAFCIGKQHNNHDLTNINNDLYILASEIENKIYINKFVSKKKENNHFQICRQL